MALLSVYIYRRQRSCGQGYVFTRVCDSVHRGVSGRENPLAGRLPPARRPPAGRPPGKETSPWGGRTPPGRRPPSRETPLGRENPSARRPAWQGAPLPPAGRTSLARSPLAGRPPGRETPRHMVNERPVCILLECILVQFKILQLTSECLCREISVGNISLSCRCIWVFSTVTGTANDLYINWGPFIDDCHHTWLHSIMVSSGGSRIFRGRGTSTPKAGWLTYSFGIFCQKLHENERIWKNLDRDGSACLARSCIWQWLYLTE